MLSRQEALTSDPAPTVSPEPTPAPTARPGHPESALSVADLLKLARKKNNSIAKPSPVMHKRLSGDCHLIVVDRELWQGRSLPPQKPVCAPIRLTDYRTPRTAFEAAKGSVRRGVA